MNVKKCSKCDAKHPATTEYFSPDKRKSFGLASQCRQCKRKLDREIKQRRRDNPVTNEIDKARVRESYHRRRVKALMGSKTDIQYSECVMCDSRYIVNYKRKKDVCPICVDIVKPVNITYKNCIDCGKLESMKLWGAAGWRRCEDCTKKRNKDLKKLEEKLDIALSNESEESLTKWLLKKRNKTYSDLANLGDGKIETRGVDYSGEQISLFYKG